MEFILGKYSQNNKKPLMLQYGPKQTAESHIEKSKMWEKWGLLQLKFGGWDPMYIFACLITFLSLVKLLNLSMFLFPFCLNKDHTTCLFHVYEWKYDCKGC